ncbi:MAG: helix-turn-helix transcriptional regulator [Planctomycetota bacterium]
MKIDELISDDAVLKELGERLKRLRKSRKYTQEGLAKDAGIGVATLRRIEDGNDGQLGSWLKIFKALGMAASIDGLLPESISSPMAEVLASQKKRRRHDPQSGGLIWGDEKP